jgi:hypothetical protein
MNADSKCAVIRFHRRNPRLIVKLRLITLHRAVGAIEWHALTTMIAICTGL